MELVNYLRSPHAIRERCQQIYDLVMAGNSDYFTCNLERLGATADYVLTEIQTNYPNLNIPFHSRWRHFEVGGVSRLNRLHQDLQQLTPRQQAVSQFDLVIISVLLDAGAGANWCYVEPETKLEFSRSEGLAIASYHMFCQGVFSDHPSQPLRVDAERLINLDECTLIQGLQVSDRNPLLGISGRLELLRRLGDVILQHPEIYGDESARPGNLLHYLLREANNQQISANTVLRGVLDGCSEIWPSRVKIGGVNLGDVWYHPQVSNDGLVPFHKLSQWLSYSLLEPLQALGLEISDLDVLTGLPEYRNGGLLIDLGVIQPKHQDILVNEHPVDSPLIVEWRSLTVILLDHLANYIRSRLELDPQTLPLAKILQGGTWSAGRKIASQLRPGATSPIRIISDGTVF